MCKSVENEKVPYENVDETNIFSVCQKVESSIRQMCSLYFHRSIVERILVDLCFSHYNELGTANRPILKRSFEDEMSLFFFRSSTLQSPHYLACFSTIYSKSEKPVDEAEYKKLRTLVTLWLFLTEIPYNGLLFYFDRLRFNAETFDLDQSFLVKDFSASRSRFEEFFSEYALFETVRPQALLHTIFQAPMDDLEGLDDIISSRIGVSPSRILKALFDLTFEWGETFKSPVDLSEPQEVMKERLQGCHLLMDYPLAFLKEILKPITASEIEKMFSCVTLTSERASKYIESRKTRKGNREISMFTYPLWDYPLLKIDQNYLCHPALFAECFEELAFRFIRCSEEATGRFVNKQHEKLVGLCCDVLAEVGFDKVETNLKATEAGIERAQFDIVASKDGKILHIECKTERTPWRMRMYFNPKELEKEGLDFLRENKLNAEAWADKVQWLCSIVEKHFGSNYKEPSNIVVTNTPTPAQSICPHVKIVWIGRLENHIHSEFKC